MERYLEGEDIEVGTLIDDLETAVARGTFHPVIPVCATSGIGLDALLEVLVGGFPSPLEHPLPRVGGVDGSAHPPLTADPGRPAGRRGGAHLGRRLRRAGLAGAGVLRDPAPGVDGARQRSPRGRPGAARPRDDGPATTRATTPTSGSRTSTARSARPCARSRSAWPATSARSPSWAPRRPGTPSRPATTRCCSTCWELPEPLLPGGRARAHPGRRGRADQDAGQDGRRGPDAAPGAQPGDPPDRALVHGRGARRRRAVPAAGRRRRGGHRAGAGADAGDHRQAGPGHRAARQAVRRARPVRGVPRRVRAAAPGLRVRVRVQGGRRVGADPVHPERGEGHPGPAAARADRGQAPGRRPQGHPGRRQGAQRRLLGRRVPDRGRAGPAGGGHGVRHGAAGAAGRGGHPDPGRAPRRGAR